MSQNQTKILFDSREQNPFLFKEYDYIRPVRETLEVGDYTLVGHDMPGDDQSVIVERKADTKELLTNIGQKWERFLNEMKGIREYKNRMILVCGPNNIEFLYRQGLTQVHPNFFYKQLAILQIEYGVPVIFMPDRIHAESYMVRYFNHIIRLMNNYA